MKLPKNASCTNPRWLIYLKDGRIGLGLDRYRRKNKTYYVVSGYGFYVDDIRPDDIVEIIAI